MVANSPVNPFTEQAQEWVTQQRNFFALGYTRDLDYRQRRLQDLRQAIVEHEGRICEALALDLGKSPFESYVTEIGLCLSEIDCALKQLPRWMKPTSVGLPPTFWPAKAQVRPEPLGVVLILGAWNYPIQVSIAPLVAAIAAGNCAIVKPSEVAPHTSRAIADLIKRAFDPMYVTAVEGGPSVSQALLAQRFDHIFFTGGPVVAKVVLANAVQHLTPVTLELGGKSPCIVEPDVDLQVAARRIAWGKFLNAGQTCLAPDYLLVHESIKAPLMRWLAQSVQEFYGADPSSSPDYGRIVNAYHTERLGNLVRSARVLFGGDVSIEHRYVAPTVVDQVDWDHPIMQEEIFGPILPVLTYRDLDGAIAAVNARPKPLAVYLFSNNKTSQDCVLRETSSGGCCINDVIMQGGATALPFGGVGASGMGRYHGKAGFDQLSNPKSIMRRPLWPDIKLRYAPFADKLAIVRKLMG